MNKTILSLLVLTTISFSSDVVIDNDLMWQDESYTDKESMAKGDKHSYGKVGKWKYAKKYCENLSFNGYTNWRLPTKKELLEAHKKTNLFENVLDYDYWTSTPASSTKAWAIYPIAEAEYKHYMSDTHYFRCVRSIN